MAGDDDRASSPVAPREKENSREGSLKVESSDNPPSDGWMTIDHYHNCNQHIWCLGAPVIVARWQ